MIADIPHVDDIPHVHDIPHVGDILGKYFHATSRERQQKEAGTGGIAPCFPRWTFAYLKGRQHSRQGALKASSM
jgi:hypothetical protein